jgi:uncharacterized membrane protein YhaH (DUF805 family)
MPAPSASMLLIGCSDIRGKKAHGLRQTTKWPMKQLLFSFSGAMSRRNYVAVAFVGVLLKHILDLIVAGFLFHRLWLPLNYIFPLGAPVSIHSLSGSDSVFVSTMVALSIPFAWVGLAATTKRFRTIGWPLWLVIFFFVPVANRVICCRCCLAGAPGRK